MRRPAELAAFAALALAVAACGGSGSGGTTATTAQAGGSAPATRGSAQQPFAWLRPGPAPASWPVARIPAGAAMPYPPGWRRIHADPGTAAAALIDRRGLFEGYLDVTPQQGGETLANWATFRPSHNAEEGDRGVKRVAAAHGLRFRNGHGTCVQDAYAGNTGVRYVEIACLVAGPRRAFVIVGAAPAARWSRTSALIERSISGFAT